MAKRTKKSSDGMSENRFVGGAFEHEAAAINQQVVIIEATGRVRRFGYTDFTDSLRPGEKILRSGVDFKGAAVFAPGIAEAIWRWKKGTFVMERELERGEELDWTE